jgi:hypothetical protein
MDSHGTRALQCLLEEIYKRDVHAPAEAVRTGKGRKMTVTSKLLIEALEKGNRTLEMMMNVRGNHVIKLVLSLLHPQQR